MSSLVSEVRIVKVTLYLARASADFPSRNFFAQCTTQVYGRLMLRVNDLHAPGSPRHVQCVRKTRFPHSTQDSRETMSVSEIIVVHK